MDKMNGSNDDDNLFIDMLNDIAEPFTNYRNFKPYYCGCRSITFPDREKFRRHMSKHNVLIPYKFSKRKAEESVDEFIPKDAKRYDTNYFFVTVASHKNSTAYRRLLKSMDLLEQKTIRLKQYQLQ